MSVESWKTVSVDKAIQYELPQMVAQVMFQPISMSAPIIISTPHRFAQPICAKKLLGYRESGEMDHVSSHMLKTFFCNGYTKSAK